MKVAERNQLQALWQQRMTDWQQSGLIQTEWCRRQQLSPHQFSYWKRKLQGSPDARFIPLTVITPEPVSPSTLVFHIDTIRVEAAPEQAAALIKALQAIA